MGGLLDSTYFVILIWGNNPSRAQMLRCLFYLEFVITLSAAHLPGVESGPADSLSRNKLSLIFDLIPQARTERGLVATLELSRSCTC